VLIGHCGERTEEPAARQVAAWFAEEGWDVHRAPIAPHFVHIDLMVCMLAPQCAAVCKDTTDDDVLDWLTSKNIELINCSYRETMKLGCNVLALGEDRILSTAENRDFNAKLRAAGFTVYDPDVSMFTLGGGGVHCMAMPLRRTAQPAR
jgi:N-dimethylarginine dimethylaminohydrolase